MKRSKRSMKRVSVWSATFLYPDSACSTITYVSKMIHIQAIKRPHIRYPRPNIELAPKSHPTSWYMNMHCTIVAIIPPRNRKDLLYENSDTAENEPKVPAE